MSLPVPATMKPAVVSVAVTSTKLPARPMASARSTRMLIGVGVTVGVSVGVGETVGGGETVGVSVAVGVAVGVCVGVAVGPTSVIVIDPSVPKMRGTKLASGSCAIGLLTGSG